MARAYSGIVLADPWDAVITEDMEDGEEDGEEAGVEVVGSTMLLKTQQSNDLCLSKQYL